MEKERGYKVVAIVALLLAVVGVGIGFAAFSATFTINEETVTVNPSENLLETGMHYTGTVTEIIMGDDVTNHNKGTASGKTWSGITVDLSGRMTTGSGSYALEAEIVNESNYDAYVTDIRFTNGGEHTTSGVFTCVAGEGTNEKLVEDFCKVLENWTDLYVTKKSNLDPTINSETDLIGFFTDHIDSYDPAPTVNHDPVAPGGKAYVTLMYELTDRSAVFPDGPFTIYLPAIEFDFSTSAPSGN